MVVSKEGESMIYHNYTRRNILSIGAASAGALLGLRSNRPARAWPPGPDENVVRDLTPGKTPIRLAINIRRRGSESPEEMIKRRRDEGYSSVKGARHPGGNLGEPWHSMTAAERSEVGSTAAH